jgi:hypothetical protein
MAELLQCRRCGSEDCPKQPLREFTVPVEMPGFYGTHWYMCLALREPVIYGKRFPVRGWLAAFRDYWRSLFALSFQRAVEPVLNAHPWVVDLSTTSEAAGGTVHLKYETPAAPFVYAKQTVKV